MFPWFTGFILLISKNEAYIYIYWKTLMRTNLFVCLSTTSILAKLSTWSFEHSGDISCSLLDNLSHTDESWAGRNTCLWVSIYLPIYLSIYLSISISISIYLYIYIHTYIYNNLMFII